jgi:hypothetical protein
MSQQLVVEIPDGFFAALDTDSASIGKELRVAAAAKWYEIGKLSQAKAAEFAGLTRYDFIQALARLKVSPIQETVEELAAGLAREK